MEQFDFRELVERLPLVVYVDQLDEKSSPIYISPQIQRLLGYTAEEWVADPDLYISSIHPEDRERILAEIGNRNTDGVVNPSFDYRLIARDGRVVWVRDDELVMADGDGVPAAVHGYLQDVTDRRSDRMRLELLVGILALAAAERAPEEIVAEAARLLASAVGDVNVTFVDVGPGGKLHARYSTELRGPVNDTFALDDYLDRLEDGPIVVDDVRNTEWLTDVQDELAHAQVGSAVDVPLRRDGRIVGVLWFNTPGPRRWDAHEVTVLCDVAEQLAAVLAGAEARERQRLAERDLRSRDAILEAVSRSAEAFLAHESLDTAMLELMRELGEATGASRAYAFQNVPSEDDLPYALRRVIWTQPGWETTIDDPRLAHVRPAPHFPRWAEVLGRGEVVTGTTSDDLSVEEQEALALIGTRSILAVPVFVDDAWWGFIGFEDCEREREWTAAETDALRAAAGLVAAAIRRQATERDLRRRDEILEAVSNAAERLLAEPSWRHSVDDLLARLGLAAGASRAYLFQCGVRADGKQIASQRNEWVAPGISPELENELMQDMCFEEVGLGRKAEISSRNEIYAGVVAELPAEERALFEEQDIRSIMTVPIFVAGTWWGFIGLDDCVNERVWSAS